MHFSNVLPAAKLALFSLLWFIPGIMSMIGMKIVALTLSST